ncbi:MULTISPECIES: CHAP domain-containing protein [unclassified Pseudomonas]|uniref:CHAP domain-containing protein n=1 Tax=unclassified Pseudomonas TaxID=196821 RepID=UPI000A1D9125|nr:MULTISPECIES: CHAP domain-containing protein [unclassified Pseudomonas]
MKSEIRLVFKDFLMQAPRGVKFQLLIDGNVIDDAITQADGPDQTYLLQPDKVQTLVTIKDTGKTKTIKTRDSHEVSLRVVGTSGAQKALNTATLTPGTRLTMVAVSPWVRVPLSTTGAVTNDVFYEVEYGVKRKNQTRTVKVMIQDMPRRILLAALQHRGSTAWAGKTSKRSLEHPTLKQSVEFAAGTNKCNLFVYDVLTSIGVNVALIEHGKSKYLPGVKNLSPPLAGEWADDTRLLNNWKVERSALPGDIGAYAVNYSNASGHVGFILAQGVCISAGWERVEVNDAGFRQIAGNGIDSDHDFTIFRRYKHSTPQ